MRGVTHSWDVPPGALITGIPLSWTTVPVSPPNDGCCTYWSAGCVNTIRAAIGAASSHTILQLKAGTYCNEKYTGAPSMASEFSNDYVGTVKKKSYLTIEAADPAHVPKIVFDGGGGFIVEDSDHITFSSLDITGPALSITGAEATHDRVRETGRDAGGCGKYVQSNCNMQQGCAWSVIRSYCSGQQYAYFNGIGFRVLSTGSLTLSDLSIHHCPSAAVHVSQSADVVVKSNLVYGNTWWTSSATSAIAFALGHHKISLSSKYVVVDNVVYGNRNFIPFYNAQHVAGGAGPFPDYGHDSQNYIVDGQGMTLTRPSDYAGTFHFSNNTVFDSGINGLSVQKATDPAFKITVEDNRFFDNGATMAKWEGRQGVGGFVINSGSNRTTSHVTANSNQISQDSVGSDHTYQCHGSCSLTSSSSGNTHCGGDPAPAFGLSAFVTTDCAAQNARLQALRANYPSSKMPRCPRYLPFLEAKGYDCVD
tara:strand:+ start:572 stop:2008 length:1437 start_codon:yes stop_codon:yes gene_type:complete